MKSLYIILECTNYFSTQILIVSIDPLLDITKHLTFSVITSKVKVGFYILGT